MNRDDVIRMAREARLAEPSHPMNPWGASDEGLERFAILVADAEREACAKLCDKIRHDNIAAMWSVGAALCSDAIRARSVDNGT